MSEPKSATEIAAAVVNHWGHDYPEAKKLSDIALGELIRRIAVAILSNTK